MKGVNTVKRNIVNFTVLAIVMTFGLLSIWSCHLPGACATSATSSKAHWEGTFVRDPNTFDTSSLKITAATNDSFYFDLHACSGGHVGMVAGTAKIVGNTAMFDDGKGNVLHFNLQDGGQITIEQSGEMQGYAATGVVFKGVYAMQAAQPTAVEDDSYFTKQKVFKDDQEAIFKKIVGGNYTKFKNTAQLFSDKEDLDHSGARVYVMDVRGLFGIMESIIMVRDSDNSIWAAVIDADGKKVLYFTNTKDVTDIPVTIKHWNDQGNKYPISYVPAQ